MHVLILSGGGGVRLWPLSRQDFPKQFLRFGDAHSLLQKTVLRFLDAPWIETVTIATNGRYEGLIREQLRKIDPHKRVGVIVEPEKKNTAPAIAYALRQLQMVRNLPDEAPFLIAPSDHLIDPPSILMHFIQETAPLLQKSFFVLFGIPPTKPETGYGYIQAGKRFDTTTFHVGRFVEKPPLHMAKEYVAAGDYYWNSGMFACTLGAFWKNLNKHAPDIARCLDRNFAEMPEISFDYAVLEKMGDLLVCPLPTRWSDVGSWDSVYDMMEKDEDLNVKQGNVLAMHTKKCLIFGGKRLISTIGLEDLLIVETEDAIFIGKRGESQRVKELASLHETGQKFT